MARRENERSVLEIRVFNDGAAFRHVIPGEQGTSGVPDEHTTFVLPAGSTVWSHDLGGHYEGARPQEGVTIRVRTAWENAAQGLPKKPIAELVRLSIDGVEVSPTLVAKKRPGGAALQDHYHQFHIANPAPGKHTATAHVRVLETKSESDRTVTFVV